MTQDEKWMLRYKEVVSFFETNHRNQSKHNDEERGRSAYAWNDGKTKLRNHGFEKWNFWHPKDEFCGIDEDSKIIILYLDSCRPDDKDDKESNRCFFLL